MNLRLTAALTPLLAVALQAQAIRVPAQQPTIAAALVAATPGTTILVAPGTYFENLVWPLTSGIRLIAERGPSVTTIDGSGTGRVILISGAHSGTARIEGFTIRNGALSVSTSYGGGIQVQHTGTAGFAPEIVGNVIRDNVCAGSTRSYGAGVYVAGNSATSPLIQGNRFVDNEAVSGSYAYGGGLYVTNVAARIVGNVFVGNLAHGAIYSFGGGLYAYSVDGAVIASNVFHQNEARDGSFVFGGGAHVGQSDDVSVVNNTFLDNTAANATFVRGGGLQLYQDTSSSIQNNIFSGNQPQGVEVYSGSALTFDYNVYWGTGGTIVGATMGSNSQVANPGVSTSSYELSATSPCLEAGSSGAVPAVVDVDFQGSPRNLDGNANGVLAVDIGADEFGKSKLALQWGQPQIGTVFNMNVTGFFGTHAWLLFVDVATGNEIIAPIGNWLLGPYSSYWAGGTMPGVANVAVPSIPGLRGITIRFQAMVASGGIGEATNRLDLTIH